MSTALTANSSCMNIKDGFDPNSLYHTIYSTPRILLLLSSAKTIKPSLVFVSQWSRTSLAISSFMISLVPARENDVRKASHRKYGYNKPGFVGC